IDPRHPSTIYAGGQVGCLVCKSTDAGDTWSRAQDGINNFITSLAIVPSHPSTVYAGAGAQVFKTTDGGQSWRQLAFGGEARALAIDPITPSTVYASQPCSGVMKTVDAGRTWKLFRHGLPRDGCPQDLAIDPG